MNRVELELYLNEALQTAQFRDYCPNGLQVEGRPEVNRLITGVTASQALLEEAIRWRADAVLVHHGYFWKGEDPRIVGYRRRRLALLLTHDINLFAYHLPLDAHPELGNNAQLGARLGLSATERFGPEQLGWLGTLETSTDAGTLAQRVGAALGRAPLLLGEPGRSVRRVAWCTGAAQNMFEAAVAAGADVYLSGEVSEQTTHLARETGVVYIGAGHHATERWGVMALGEHLAQRFGIEHRFVDIVNPV
ncbi:MAG: Nif3-like dinuclear metal center hexameric protein [Burkholderiales bacterium]|nr:Nif3-like dinuclear metal center hexameric protein [Burkholderiales bacterium]MDE2287242.1 Nif3-like dinuclear metal center hexameric protein [Burkholderiales bacterium]MDE2608845.1 Nif3-like dinuclear metal center hexameric protein [Burkholderiales bacterium]